MINLDLLKEGGNAIPSSTPVKKEDVAGVVATAKRELPPALLKNIQVDIGSAGYKIESGDIDVMIEANDLVAVFKTQDDKKDPVLAAKKALESFFAAKGIEAKTNGRNVSIGVRYKESSTAAEKIAQVDVMIIQDTALVAPYHQHGTRGMYSDPNFKGNAIFMLISSVAKSMNMKFDAFGAKLVDRDTGEVYGRSRDDVAKILLNPNATGDDLNSVKTIMQALRNDPNKDAKLAQAREDEKKGLLTLPESANSNWFRQWSNLLK